jgi:hypothetical protein
MPSLIERSAKPWIAAQVRFMTCSVACQSAAAAAAVKKPPSRLSMSICAIGVGKTLPERIGANVIRSSSRPRYLSFIC